MPLLRLRRLPLGLLGLLLMLCLLLLLLWRGVSNHELLLLLLLWQRVSAAAIVPQSCGVCAPKVVHLLDDRLSDHHSRRPSS